MAPICVVGCTSVYMPISSININFKGPFWDNFYTIRCRFHQKMLIFKDDIPELAVRAGTSSGEIWISTTCLFLSMRFVVEHFEIHFYPQMEAPSMSAGLNTREGFSRERWYLFFHIFYSKGSVVLSSLVLSPVPIPVFVFTRLCSKIPCHITYYTPECFITNFTQKCVIK